MSARPAEPPIDEDNEGTADSSIMRHARRMSASASAAGWPTAAPRFGQAATHEQHERGQALLRRLSLGSALVRVRPSFSLSFSILRIFEANYMHTKYSRR